MRASILVLLLCIFPLIAEATLLRVPSEYPTIQAGIDACSEGDTVLVAPGTYTGEGNWNLNYHGTNLVLASEAGAETTIIDCNGRGNRGILFMSGEGPGSVLQGFTIQDGYTGSGGGILIEDSSPTLIDIHVVGCGTNGKGGGLACYRGSPLVQDAVFLQNSAAIYYSGTLLGGGVYCEDSWPVFDNVLFDDNAIVIGFSDWSYDTSCLGAGLAVVGGSAVVNSSTFQGNYVQLDQGPNGGGAIYVDGEIRLTNVTIVGNYSYYGSAIKGNTAHVVNGIIAFNRYDQPVLGQAHLQCTDVFGHGAYGDYVGSIADQNGVNGNFSSDPLFCGVSGSGNYYLQSDSPCLPDNNDCGVLIGAYDVGCEDTPVLLSHFTATPSAVGVDLRWQLGGPVTKPEFRLSAESADVMRDLVWQEDAPGQFSAMDHEAVNSTDSIVIYRLEGREDSEAWQLLGSLQVEVPSSIMAAKLLDPFPNPFNPSTTIAYELTEASPVHLAVYDLAGRLVRMLVAGENVSAGIHEVTWDGRDGSGQSMSSGVYFCRLTADSFAEARSMVLLK